MVNFSKIKEFCKNNIGQRKIFNRIVQIYDLFSSLFMLYILRLILESLNKTFKILAWRSEIEGKIVYDLATVLIFIHVINKKNNEFIIKNVVKGIRNNLDQFIIGFVLSIVMNSFITLISYVPILKEIITKMFNVQSLPIVGVNSILFMVNVVLFTPIVEEYIFRKKIFEKVLSSQYKSVAVFVASLLFAVIHYLNIMWAVLAFAFSILLCEVYKKHGYFGSLSMHIGFNTLTLVNYVINKFLDTLRYDKAVALLIYIFYFTFGIMILYRMFRKEGYL